MPETLNVVVREGEFVCRSLAISLHECLRYLPGRRAVHRASGRQGEAWLVKRFVHPDKALSDAKKEWESIQTLRKKGIPTPAPAFLAQADDHWVLATEYLAEAVTLQDQKAPDLQAFLELINLGYKAGAVQDDLHLDNFLSHLGRLYCVDAASFRFFPNAAPMDAQLANLALLKANIPLPWQVELEQSWGAMPAIGESVYRQVLIKRIRKFARKCERTCTAFERIERSGITLWRTRDCPAWIDDWVTLSRDQLRKRAEVLKDGDSCLVVRHEQDWVLKRRFYKGRLPVVWKRRSRARKSWIAGNVLRLIGLNTPKPWACWEIRKQGKLISDGLLMSNDPGTALHEWVREPDHRPEIRFNVAANFRVLFDQFALIGASHGDTKASNFRIGTEGDLRVIDLDSFTLHRTSKRAKRMARRDRERFARNQKKYPEGKDIFAVVSSPPRDAPTE